MEQVKITILITANNHTCWNKFILSIAESNKVYIYCLPCQMKGDRIELLSFFLFYVLVLREPNVINGDSQCFVLTSNT